MSEYSVQRAKELVKEMTLEEKISQMLYQSPAIERLKIPAYNWWNESLHGVARAGVATVFPQVIGLAASFDPKLLYQIADVISTEGRAKYNSYSKNGDRGIYKGLTFWAPNINIFRDPRWGRGHETFGEDPFLTAELGIAYIKGIQGEDKENLKAAACVKHYAVHSGPEALRHEFDAVVSRKDLYETYLYAFKRCVKEAGVEAVMGAYNRVNGVPACGSKELLIDILREEWGFLGHVVSDCWAIKDFHEHHHVTNTITESAAMAVNNGCDLNCGSAFLHLEAAVKQQLITEEKITEAVERLVEVRIRLGMLNKKKSVYDQITYDVVECKEHVDLSVKAAIRSLVLLKNQNHILPLDQSTIKTIGVIGPNANSREALVGNYIGTSSSYVTILEGIQKEVGSQTRILYSEGCHLFHKKTEFLAEEKDRFAEAKQVAKESEVVILCLGLDATIEGEQGDAGNEYAGGDKPDLALPGLQQELLEFLVCLNKPIILINVSGSAMDLSWANDHVDAIIQAWYPGARGGIGVADVLFGKTSPSGKLPVTFYQNVDNLPEFTDYSMKNRTYRYANDSVLYPFGYGLTYSKIEYIDVKPKENRLQMGQSLTVNVKLKNVGDYVVHESIEAYVKNCKRIEHAPGFQLKGLVSVELKSNEEKTVELIIPAQEFGRITEEGKSVTEPGDYLISIGNHQPDERSEELTKMKNIEFVLQITE